MYYKLNRKTGEISPSTLEEWAHTIRPEETRICQTRIEPGIFDKEDAKPISVSTVFLGLDHNFLNLIGSPPILFETMVFGLDDDADGIQLRCSTLKEAEAQHILVVSMIEEIKVCGPSCVEGRES